MRCSTWPEQVVSGGCCRASFRRLPPCRTISMLGATTAFWGGSTSSCWLKREKLPGAKPAPRPGSSTANPSRPPRAAAPAGMMLAKKSKDASAISSPIRLASSSAPRFTPPIFKTAMAPRSSSKPFTISSPGCATSSPIVPIPATNWRRLSPDSAAGRSRSSNETLPASSCFPAGGWSNALSLGSIATAAWPKTLRLRSPVPRLGSTSLASNSSLGDWHMVKTTYTIKIQTLKRLIREGVDYTSAVCVLIGTSTWTRRWVRYEVARGVIDGRGLLAVHINGIRHHQTKMPNPSGLNPLEFMAVGKVQNNVLVPPKYYLFERDPHHGWVKAHPVVPGWSL